MPSSLFAWDGREEEPLERDDEASVSSDDGDTSKHCVSAASMRADGRCIVSASSDAVVRCRSVSESPDDAVLCWSILDVACCALVASTPWAKVVSAIVPGARDDVA
jgi:hypothetical protein